DSSSDVCSSDLWKKAVFPDLLEKMAQRYNVLYTISLHEPVGRRAIVDRLRLPERLIRNELDTLQQLGFVTSSTKGMLMTAEGKDAIIQRSEERRVGKG